MIIGGEGQRSLGESSRDVCLPAYEAAVSGASWKKQETPQYLEHLQNALLPEDKEFVPSITHRKSGFFFTSIPSRRGSLGTAVVVGPRALAALNLLLPDAVAQQPTVS